VPVRPIRLPSATENEQGDADAAPGNA
jgi:host factor-I protein